MSEEQGQVVERNPPPFTSALEFNIVYKMLQSYIAQAGRNPRYILLGESQYRTLCLKQYESPNYTYFDVYAEEVHLFGVRLLQVKAESFFEIV